MNILIKESFTRIFEAVAIAATTFAVTRWIDNKYPGKPIKTKEKTDEKPESSGTDSSV